MNASLLKGFRNLDQLVVEKVGFINSDGKGVTSVIEDFRGPTDGDPGQPRPTVRHNGIIRIAGIDPVFHDQSLVGRMEVEAADQLRGLSAEHTAYDRRDCAAAFRGRSRRFAMRRLIKRHPGIVTPKAGLGKAARLTGRTTTVTIASADLKDPFRYAEEGAGIPRGPRR